MSTENKENPTVEIPTNGKLRKYIITIIVGLVIAFIVLLIRNVFTLKTKVEILHVLSDAFFISGFLLFGFGLLVFASNEGTFDMLVFGFAKLINVFKRDMTKSKYKTFYDYRVSKQEKKQSFGFMVIVGLGLILVSLVFLFFWNKVS